MNLDIDMDLKVGDISAKLDVNGDWKLEKPKNALMSATEANIGGFHLHLFQFIFLLIYIVIKAVEGLGTI